MQTRLIRTHNAYHLGDNLVHLHFLRKVSLANRRLTFIHAAKWQYLDQLRPVIEDIPQIALVSIDNDPFYAHCDYGARYHHTATNPNPDYPKNWNWQNSINAWRGA